MPPIRRSPFRPTVPENSRIRGSRCFPRPRRCARRRRAGFRGCGAVLRVSRRSGLSPPFGPSRASLRWRPGRIAFCVRPPSRVPPTRPSTSRGRRPGIRAACRRTGSRCARGIRVPWRCVASARRSVRSMRGSGRTRASTGASCRSGIPSIARR